MSLELILSVAIMTVGCFWTATAVVASSFALRWYLEGYPDSGDLFPRLCSSWAIWQALSYVLIGLFGLWLTMWTYEWMKMVTDALVRMVGGYLQG